MATNCNICGHRTNEVKPGAGIEDKGIKIQLKIKDENDLKREVVIVSNFIKHFTLSYPSLLKDYQN